MSQKLALVLSTALTVCVVIVAGRSLTHAADLTIPEEASVEDDPSTPRYIQTVRGYGYRLVNPHAPPITPP
jgi:hypothetical protein